MKLGAAKAGGKRGPPRKSRRPRLGSAIGVSPYNFVPDAADWDRMAQAYGVTFSDAQKDRMAAIVSCYLSAVASERRAPFLSDSLAWLDESEATVNAFHTWLEGNHSYEKDQAKIFARTALEYQIYGAPVDNLRVFALLLQTTTPLLAAFEAARQQLTRDAQYGFEEGQTWRWMIGRLLEFANLNGFPASASKGYDKSKTGTTSPFVAFVRELQRTLPAETRRHTASDLALAEGIGVARRKFEAKRKIIEGE